MAEGAGDEIVKKSCGTCVNCEKGSKSWTCENVSGSEGWPCDCTPPNDEPCANWSDKAEDKDKPQDALRYFVDHFWDEE